MGGIVRRRVGDMGQGAHPKNVDLAGATCSFISGMGVVFVGSFPDFLKLAELLTSFTMKGEAISGRF